MNTDQRLDYIEDRCSNLGAAKSAQVLAYLLGAILTHFDFDPVMPLTDSRWARLVETAIAEVAR